MDFAPLIAKKADRFRELEAEIGSGSLYDDPRKARETLREHTRLKELLAHWEELKKAGAELAENQALAKGDDPEFVELAAAEIPALEKRIAGAEKLGHHKTSMLQDVEAARALEIDALLGSVVELARHTNTPTPHIDTVYALTKLLAKSLEQGKL